MTEQNKKVFDLDYHEDWDIEDLAADIRQWLKRQATEGESTIIVEIIKKEL